MDRDRNIGVLGYEDPAAAPYIPAIPDEDFERSYQLLLPDGRRLQTGEATVTLMETVKPTRWLGRLARRLRLTGFIGVLYRMLSRRRAKLANLVPKGPGPRRPP